jgi:L-seryl-tRNA(Ser) seleniumtransferase
LDIAHGRGVPVIVDAAAMLPPAENLTRYVEMGADMVSFSGGKGVLGPQSTGILCGRADLIEAAYANSSPTSDAIGRSAKVCKEEIAGLVTAVELFVDTDHQAVQADWRAKCQRVVSELQDIPGLRVELAEAAPELQDAQSGYPSALILFDRAWTGPTQEEVDQRLRDGDPAIRVRPMEFPDGIAVVPVNLQHGQEVIVAQRLREALTAQR